MTTHTTPPPHADQTDQTDQTAEPARRASRFDERGIALQTVIIMVVLLAIAGTVAAVLFSRASDVTGDLESQDVTSATIDSAAECTNHLMGGVAGVWTAPNCKWTSASANTANPADVTRGRCQLVGGTYVRGSTTVTATCTV